MSRRDWLAAAVIIVVAVAIAAFLLRDTGDDAAPRAVEGPPSARVMSAPAADELIARLEQRGWSCFDSLEQPVVKRCFLDELAGAGTVSADVALTFADGYLTRVNLYAAGEGDDDRHVTVAEQTAELAGDILLDGAGSEVAERLGDRHEVEIAGRRVFGNRAPGASVQVVVESASYDAKLPPAEFPSNDVLTRAAKDAGLLCHDDGSSTICSGTAGSISMTVTMSVASGRIGSLSLSASNFAVPNDPVVLNAATGYLFETGIGGPRAAAWVREHAGGAWSARADLGGLQLRLGNGADRAVYLTVSAIQN
jgi:hypothetical protein